MKKTFLSLLICFVLVIASVVVAFAEVPPPHFGEDRKMPNSPVIFHPPVDKMTPSQKEAAGLVDPFQGLQTRATVEKLCYIDGGPRIVYASVTDSIEKGYVDSRDRVWVYNNDAKADRYYIRFLNRGKIDYGFVEKSAVKIPSKNWSKPISSGRISVDYSVSNHKGIDVATPEGTAVYAVTNVIHRSRVYTAFVEGSVKLVNYGNYVDCYVNDIQVIYAHLSKFTHGTASELESYRGYYGESNANISTVDTFSPSSGAKIGEVGNTGNSFGAHLHFQTRSKDLTQEYDPFSFVVFPDVG